MHRYEQVGEAELNYGNSGNLLMDGTNNYSYDILNRQISVNGLDNSAEYVYDALGRRVAKVVDGVTIYYLYNAGEQVIEERDSTDALQARYRYGSGIDRPLTMERGGNVYYYHRDGLGSVTEISDASGALVECYEYLSAAAQAGDVYGAPTISKAVNLFDDLGYDNWQEGVERFADDYDAGDWWTDDGSWTGKKSANLKDKTLYPKRPPSAPPEFIEPESPICEPEGPTPPGPDDTPFPWMPPGYWNHPPEPESPEKRYLVHDFVKKYTWVARAVRQ